jgi:hypothetical protein
MVPHCWKLAQKLLNIFMKTASTGVFFPELADLCQLLLPLGDGFW